MDLHSELDLTAVEWPMCLIESKRLLDETACGSFLDILVADPAVLEMITILAENAFGRITAITRENERFRISIHKKDSRVKPGQGRNKP